ncbi:PGPGW domain-containing protein [Nocardioides sp. InS609-2]|uniref:PGPGW domain-containing protein n=1 Tax=Nocardioides sp. InS609-2 TaxID=2760705 RepID=UPI0020BFDC78|nr:PGPGW domain-containing protein [Nocardioides sp. InS609-2]
MALHVGRRFKRVLIEGAGWLLVLLGIAALVLPGPGLLALFAGLALLATQYEWAEKRLEPVKRQALRTAADSVASWPRILMSALGVAGLVAVGITWGLRADAPSWWPLSDSLWLPGGWGTGISLIVSAAIAAGMIIYSYLNFREIREEEAEGDDVQATSATEG